MIVGLVLGGICGWALGFLRLPLIVKNDSFWVGLLAGISLFSLVLVVRSSFVRKSVATVSFTKRIWIGGIAIFLVSGGLLVFTLLSRSKHEFKEQLIQKKAEFLQEQALIHAMQQANLGSAMESLFGQIQAEIASNNGKLSSSTIDEVARISQSFEPYAYFQEDSLTTRKFSPERGQLLLFLIASNMDTASFNQTILQTTFAGADLEGAHLSGLNLRGINLMGANLRDAILNEVDLHDSDLRGAILWGAQLRGADLKGIDMRRADVRWAELAEASLRSAHLDGADFSNTLMREVDMEQAKFQFGTMNGAMLYGANLVQTDFLKTSLTRTDFSKANLTWANLQRTDILDVNFEDANLTGVALQEADWLAKLSEWNVAGEQAISDTYIVAKDTAQRFHDVHFLLGHPHDE